jgi:hypothetical protein
VSVETLNEMGTLQTWLSDDQLYSASAVLRKWPSYKNQRTGTPPYLIVEGTLDECVRKYAAYPTKSRHLYDIQVTVTGDARAGVLPEAQLAHLARFHDFMWTHAPREKTKHSHCR